MFTHAYIFVVLCLLWFETCVEAAGGLPEAKPPLPSVRKVKEGAPREPKFLNLFSIEKVTTVFENRKAECENEFRGTYITTEDLCLRYVPEKLNFDPAVEECEDLGGSLWIPDFTDIEEIPNIAKDFPPIYSITDRNIFVGVRALDERLITIEGQDVTDTYYGVLSDITSASSRHNGCVVLDLRTKFPSFKVEGCDGSARADFFCEFSLKAKDLQESKKYLKFMKPFIFEKSAWLTAPLFAS